MGLIMGMNALLLDSPLNDKQRQHAEISHRNARRLLRLINGILDLSKVEAGKLELAEDPFDLKEMLEECALTVSAAVKEKGLEFEVFTDLNTGRYWIGDSERLQQVLLNLIGNSIKFTAGLIYGKCGMRWPRRISLCFKRSATTAWPMARGTVSWRCVKSAP
jgi:signal transduction histidine kinase